MRWHLKETVVDQNRRIRGSEQYHATKSSANRYDRLDQSERQPEPHLDLAVRSDGRCYAACSRVADAGAWQVELR